MEVYSIIKDLHQISTYKSLLSLTRDALIRNRYLLRKYSMHFKNCNNTQFIRKVRTLCKQNTFTARAEGSENQEISFPMINYQSDNHKQIATRLRLKLESNLQRQKSQWGSFQQQSFLKSGQKSKRMLGTLKGEKKMRKKLLEECQNGKISIISLGQNFEEYDQKIRSYLRYWQKRRIGRIKNWYYSSKSTSRGLQGDFGLMNYSLGQEMNKKLSKH